VSTGHTNIRPTAKADSQSVLVYVPASETSPIRILHALPITETFSTALLQTPPSPSTSFFAQSSKPREKAVPNNIEPC
jgi:hypothetical protein